MKLEDLELSMRTFNVLRRNGVTTVEELEQMTQKDLIKMRNIGRTSLHEIQQVLEARETVSADPVVEPADNYDVTMSFTIHCKDAEERDTVLKKIKNMGHLILHA